MPRGNIMDSDEVHKLFDEMTERGCLVDVPAFDSYLEALCNCVRVGIWMKRIRYFRRWIPMELTQMLVHTRFSSEHIAKLMIYIRCLGCFIG